MQRTTLSHMACQIGVLLSLCICTSTSAAEARAGDGRPAPGDTAAATHYEEPSWMKQRRAEERRQALWRAQVKAAFAPARNASKARRKTDSTAARVRTFWETEHERASPGVLMSEAGDPSIEALRLQIFEENEELVRLRKLAAKRRVEGCDANCKDEDKRLQAAQQSRRDDEKRLEAAQESRRQDQKRADADQLNRRRDEARLEAAQQSRREDEARLEAAEQSRREDQARQEAAEAARRSQH